MTRTVERFESEWGGSSIAAEDLHLLAEFTGLSTAACLERLSAYTPRDMAAGWRIASPRTPSEIRDFYSSTDLYLWELLAWNGSARWQYYRDRLARIAARWPPEQFPRALDFGSGVGTAALILAELGYEVTISDVPGTTFEFAQQRLRRRGLRVITLPVAEAIPVLPSGHFDVLVSFDVFEHVPSPAQVARTVVAALKPGGGACVVVSFDESNEDWPHHLPEGHRKFRGHRFGLFLQGIGLKHVEEGLFVKAPPSERLLRRLRYEMWRATGFHVERYPR